MFATANLICFQIKLIFSFDYEIIIKPICKHSTNSKKKQKMSVLNTLAVFLELMSITVTGKIWRISEKTSNRL